MFPGLTIYEVVTSDHLLPFYISAVDLPDAQEKAKIFLNEDASLVSVRPYEETDNYRTDYEEWERVNLSDEGELL